jgi:hypothetical protein
MNISSTFQTALKKTSHNKLLTLEHGTCSQTGDQIFPWDEANALKFRRDTQKGERNYLK